MVSESHLFRSTRVPAVRICKLPIITDQRGSLSFAELEGHLPFAVRRFFVVFNVPAGQTRGNHAHRTVHQFLVCVKGSCSVTVDDGSTHEELRLDDASVGVHLPPGIWASQHDFSSDAALVVLSSDTYDPAEYVRDYQEFLNLTAHG